LEYWRNDESKLQVKSRAVQERDFRCEILHRRAAAFMVSSAHIAIARHFLAAIHFFGGHRAIWQTSKQRRPKPEEGENRGEDTAASHMAMLHQIWERPQNECFYSNDDISPFELITL
jgi:hypothetical protein